MIRRCEDCGTDQECYHSDHAGWFCVDYWDCVERQRPQQEADKWYAAELERLRERAPA